MLGFALVAGGFAVREAIRLRANPTPITVRCEAEALADVPSDRWIVVESCEPLLDDIFARDEPRQELLVPLRAATAGIDEPPIALLVVTAYAAIDAHESLDGSESAAKEFITRLQPDRIEGVTGRRYGAAGKSSDALLSQRFDLPDDGIVSIARDDIPQTSSMLAGIIAALVLLPLGAVYFARARRQPDVAAEPLPPGLPR